MVCVFYFTLTNIYNQLNDLVISYEQTPVASPIVPTRSPAPKKVTAAPEEDMEYFIEAPLAAPPDIESVSYLLYNGILELPVNGATGFAPIRVEMRGGASQNAPVTKNLEPGASFLILGESGEWWEVEHGGETGFVRHAACMINLPDVIPSIRYNATNTYNSRFASSSYAIPNISGEALYAGRLYNERLGKDEYIVAVMYAMSLKIAMAQRSALAEGNCLVIYEGFRPLSVQKKISSELLALAESNEDVMAGLNAHSWGISWFIASGVSTHQRGCAIDVSLVQPELDYAVSGPYKYLTHSKAPYYYDMPSPIHELSSESVAFAYPVGINVKTAIEALPLSAAMQFNDAGKNLQRYCVTAGLMPLASEWWHFDDFQTRDTVPNASVGDYILNEIFSVPPKNVDE